MGDKPLPQRLPEYVGFGDPNEAVAYAANFLRGWKATPGAISWLREIVATTKRRKKTSPPRTEQAAPVLDDDEIRTLPQEGDEAWQADVRRMPLWVQEQGRRVRPWMILVTDATNDAILAHQVTIDEPAPELLWGQVTAAIAQPMQGVPHRPGIVQLYTATGLRFIQSRLETIGIRCEVRDDLDHIDYVVEKFSERRGADVAPPALVDAGIEQILLGRFFEAAAAFYRLAPWRLVAGDTPIEVVCRELSARPWYAVVMGQSGVELGLALYDDLAVLRSILKQVLSESQTAGRTSAISLAFGEPFEMPIRDLDSIERHGWPVAAPEAYPCVLRIHPEMRLESPKPQELELLEAALRTIPGFLARQEKAAEMTIAPCGRVVSLRRVEC